MWQNVTEVFSYSCGFNSFPWVWWEAGRISHYIRVGNDEEAEWTWEDKKPNSEAGGSFTCERLKTRQPTTFYPE